nr:lipid phosphate phosphatase 2 [Ipomoea trifida]GMD33956.1 probable lipid phosphate phosphatase 4 [Ipomoea batatas]
MSDIQFGGHTIKSHGHELAKLHKYDWMILLLLALIDGFLYIIEPFHRYTNADMMRDLKYPFKVHSTIPIWAVAVYAVILPCTIFYIYYLHRKNVYDLHHAVLGIMYSMLIAAVITDSIKAAVGRPRPNFFWRCFPDGIEAYDPVSGDVECTGLHKFIKEGYKSFPSGHTSLSFAGLGFLAWYLSGKIKAFDRSGHSAKLCIVLLPYLVAALVGVSRVDDYWHHWTDVFAGAVIGSVVSSLCYLQFFPFPHDRNGWGPYAYFRTLEENGFQRSLASMSDEEEIQDLEARGRRH